ncbi:MAG TPA: hypothetical protein VFT39_11790 [Vicinamibacterales bacterium]|nr:hypothetical protein [Vicinamibacterales bacterium]
MSTILWVSFLLIREPAQQAEKCEATGPREIVRYGWFALSATVLTVLASLFLFAPNTVLYWEFPRLSNVFDAHQGELASLRVSMLAAGSGLTPLATATWVATAHSRRNRTPRQAITLARIAYAGLVCLLPLRQIVPHAGWNCSTSLVLIPLSRCLSGGCYLQRSDERGRMYDNTDLRNQSAGLSGAEAHRGGGRLAQPQPPPGRQPDLSALEEDRAWRLLGESAHADV